MTAPDFVREKHSKIGKKSSVSAVNLKQKSSGKRTESSGSNAPTLPSGIRLTVKKSAASILSTKRESEQTPVLSPRAAISS